MNRIVVTTLALSLAATPALQAALPTTGRAKATTAPAKPVVRTAAEEAAFAEIQKSFSSKDYENVVKQTAKALASKPDRAVPGDRYTLLMLKGESHLQMKQGKSAGDAFLAAARETPDPLEAARARAMSRAIRDAKNFVVRRKTPTRGEKVMEANLLQPAEREEVLRIVYEEALSAAERPMKDATRARVLPPIQSALEAAKDLTDLELAATGSDAETMRSQRDLLDRGNVLINKELERMKKDVADIKAVANLVVRERVVDTRNLIQSRGNSVTASRTLQGVSKEDANRLQAIQSDCVKIIEVAKGIAVAATGEITSSEPLVETAEEIARSAGRVLVAKY